MKILFLLIFISCSENYIPIIHNNNFDIYINDYIDNYGKGFTKQISINYFTPNYEKLFGKSKISEKYNTCEVFISNVLNDKCLISITIFHELHHCNGYEHREGKSIMNNNYDIDNNNCINNYDYYIDELFDNN